MHFTLLRNQAPYARILLGLGRFDESLAVSEAALRRAAAMRVSDPSNGQLPVLSIEFRYNVAWALQQRGELCLAAGTADTASYTAARRDLERALDEFVATHAAYAELDAAELLPAAMRHEERILERIEAIEERLGEL